MLVRRVVQVLVVVAAFALTSGAQEEPKKTIQHVPIKPTSPVSGKAMFTSYCAACHGDDAKGNKDIGAPNLTTKVWLYGSSLGSIEERITNGGGAVMPAWQNKLSPTEIKAVTVFVHSLGGGK